MKNKFLFLLIVLTACSVKLMVPNSVDVSRMQQKVPGITLEKANEGYHLYVQHCATCHQIYKPSKFTASQWLTILEKMYPKAKVYNATDQQLIKDYLVGLSK